MGELTPKMNIDNFVSSDKFLMIQNEKSQNYDTCVTYRRLIEPNPIKEIRPDKKPVVLYAVSRKVYASTNSNLLKLLGSSRVGLPFFSMQWSEVPRVQSLPSTYSLYSNRTLRPSRYIVVSMSTNSP